VEIKSTDLLSIFEEALSGKQTPQFDEVGFVVEVGDFTCKVYGLKNAVYGELIACQGGNQGIVLSLDEEGQGTSLRFPLVWAYWAVS
jgi:F-type H+-transporting ATPase subunit alpha